MRNTANNAIKNIRKAASELTGFAIKYVHGERRMFLNDKEVDAVSANAGLITFIQLLEKVPGEKKILLAHNCKRTS